MKYALNLGKAGRILSATYSKYAPPDAVQVDVLPDGNLTDYRYADGAFVLDPLPAPPTPPSAPTLEQRTAAVENAVAQIAPKQESQDAQIAYIGMMAGVI